MTRRVRFSSLWHTTPAPHPTSTVWTHARLPMMLTVTPSTSSSGQFCGTSSCDSKKGVFIWLSDHAYYPFDEIPLASIGEAITLVKLTTDIHVFMVPILLGMFFDYRCVVRLARNVLPVVVLWNHASGFGFLLICMKL